MKDICILENDRLYVNENGLHIRDVVIDAGVDEQIVIGMLSDVHLNYCNEQDFAEADPVLMSTYKNRLWCANGETVPKLKRCLEFLKDADKLVICGDTLDYISHGTMELMDREVWDKCPDALVVAGGHEFAIQMQGEVPEKLTYEQRVEMAEKFWRHDIYYKCDVVKNKVMVIGMLNDLAKFNEYQLENLKKDLETAREKGYSVLIFAHEPIATYNEEYEIYTLDMVMQVGDPAGFPKNFATGNLAGNPKSDDVTKEVYNLIVNSTDVIKGVFAGHYHNHMNFKIKANGGFIPQFVHSATAYDEGHLMRIVVK